MAPVKWEEMQHAVQEMAATGVIEKTDSPWCSLMILVVKKDDKKVVSIIVPLMPRQQQMHTPCLGWMICWMHWLESSHS